MLPGAALEVLGKADHSLTTLRRLDRAENQT